MLNWDETKEKVKKNITNLLQGLVTPPLQVMCLKLIEDFKSGILKTGDS